jgi:hypothetical protein
MNVPRWKAFFNLTRMKVFKIIVRARLRMPSYAEVNFLRRRDSLGCEIHIVNVT